MARSVWWRHKSPGSSRHCRRLMSFRRPRASPGSSSSRNASVCCVRSSALLRGSSFPGRGWHSQLWPRWWRLRRSRGGPSISTGWRQGGTPCCTRIALRSTALRRATWWGIRKPSSPIRPTWIALPLALRTPITSEFLGARPWSTRLPRLGMPRGSSSSFPAATSRRAAWATGSRRRSSRTPMARCRSSSSQTARNVASTTGLAPLR